MAKNQHGLYWISVILIHKHVENAKSGLNSMYRVHTGQGRIQDFPLGGHQPSLEGAPTSDTGTFR